MSAHVAARLGWSLWAISVAAVGIGLLLLAASGAAASPGHDADLLMDLTFVAFSAVGALLLSRQPGNAIGWLFCAIGVVQTLGLNGLGYGYVHYAALGQRGALPAGEWVAWVSGLLNAIGLGLGPLIALLFPTGRAPSPRWHPAVWLVLVLLGINVALTAFTPGPLAAFPTLNNPAGLPALRAVAGGSGPVLAGGSHAAPFLIGAIAVLARLRRARGVERQQIKWSAYSAAGVAGAIVLLHAGPTFLGPGDRLQPIGGLIWALAVAGVPVSIGVAILRHRLYDIDLIIRRTLVYGALSGVLVAIYVGGVVLLQQLFRALAGQTSDLAIVGSTLAIAALFQPLRSSIQRVIDRRFYRRRYDAAKVLAAFGTTVRDEVDLASLTARLIQVVEDTMEPMHVSVWLSGAPEAGFAPTRGGKGV